MIILTSFFKSRKWALWAWGGLLLIVALVIIDVRVSVYLNNWYREFYDLLQKPEENTLEDFWRQIASFAYVVLPLVFVTTFNAWFSGLYSLRWREAVTYQYIPLWHQVDEEIEGASQRIQEDTQKFAAIVRRLFVVVLNAILTLIAFLPILWTLSKSITLPLLGAIPGSLVWVALTTSLGGLAIAWLVTLKLPGLEYNNQKVEAAFRKELVYGEDNKRDYAHPDKILTLFTGIRLNYQRLFLNYTYYNAWELFFRQVLVFVPLIIAAPQLFAGAITLGVLFQINNAMDKVSQSFSVILSNWDTIVEFRSIIKRLREFETNLPRKPHMHTPKLTRAQIRASLD